MTKRGLFALFFVMQMVFRIVQNRKRLRDTLNPFCHIQVLYVTFCGDKIVLGNYDFFDYYNLFVNHTWL